ncbi:MAG: hypothetical protein DCC75_08795 [Proteobacteria bacterium]|nr:MAG: hypothetical protein DCC75_08795 [Pseudomonadota bacterium]
MTQLTTRDKIIEALHKVKDPALYLEFRFHDLSYHLQIEGNQVDIDMTFTSLMRHYQLQLAEQNRKGAVNLGFETVNIRMRPT